MDRQGLLLFALYRIGAEWLFNCIGQPGQVTSVGLQLHSNTDTSDATIIMIHNIIRIIMIYLKSHDFHDMQKIVI